MTPTPPLPDADVAAVNLQASGDSDALRLLIETAALNSLPDSHEAKVTIGFMRGLAVALQEAERERDEALTWKTATHEQWAAWTRDDFKARAEAAEAREAALREALGKIVTAETRITRNRHNPVENSWLTETGHIARAALAAADPEASK